MTGFPPAKFGTARDPDRHTLGARAAIVSEALGAPFMPWQQHVADVALEVDVDSEGRFQWRYPVVIVTVPRQAGKTTLLRAIAVDRALSRENVQVFLTAQTGKDARARWRDWSQAATSSSSPLAAFVDVRKAAGTEALGFPNGSAVSPFAPTPTSLHGYTPPLIMVDEAWSFDELAGGELMAAITPSQSTIPDRQLWLVSTMGDATSTWWHSLCDRGREHTQDPAARVAYFEWSADELLDPYDPDALDFHPALGHTQRRDTLHAMAQGESLGNWRRGFLNLRTETRESILDLTVFDTLHAGAHDPDISECWIGYAVAGDRSAASIWAAHIDEHGRPCLHLSATDAGAAWLVPALLDLSDRGPAGLVAYDRGNTRPITAALVAAGRTVETLTAAQWSAATVGFLGHITDRTLRHDANAGLRRALEVAAVRPSPSGRALDELLSAGPIDHAAAVVAASWQAEHQPAGIPIF